MGSEWGREQLQLLKATYEEFEMDKEGPDYKKRVQAIMKIDLKKLQQEAAGVRKARAAAEKVKLVWGHLMKWLPRAFNTPTFFRRRRNDKNGFVHITANNNKII